MNYIEKHKFEAKKVSDCHLHIDRPYPVEEKAIHLKEICDYFNLDKVALLALTDVCADYELDMTDIACALYLKDVLKPIPYALASFFHTPCVWDDKDGCLKQVMKFREIGFDGMKILESKADRFDTTNRPLDAVEYDSFFAYCEETQFPILIHIGDFKNPLTAVLHEQFERVLERYPKLKVIIAHFGFFCLEPDNGEAHWGRLFDKYENLYTDLAIGGPFFLRFSEDIPRWRNFFTKYQDRILYGTDTFVHEFTEEGIDEDIAIRHNIPREFFECKDEFFHSFLYDSKSANGETIIKKIKPMYDMDYEVLDKIYRQNFIRVFGDKPRDINYKEALICVEKLLAAFLSGKFKNYEGDGPSWYFENECKNLLHANTMAIDNLKTMKEYFESKLK